LAVISEKYVHEHFKWTWLGKKWLLVAIKPVTRQTWYRMRKYGEPRGWEFSWDKESAIQSITIPMSEKEIEQLEKTGDPRGADL